MFWFFKPAPVKKLKMAHAKKLVQAFHAQRNGDMPRFASLTCEAETFKQEIQKRQKDSA